MTITLPITLIGIAFLLTLIHACVGKVPLWIPVLLILIAMLVR